MVNIYLIANQNYELKDIFKIYIRKYMEIYVENI